MTVIHIYRVGTEYRMVRRIRDRASPKSISCESLMELTTVLMLLGVAEAGVRDIVEQLTEFADADVRM